MYILFLPVKITAKIMPVKSPTVIGTIKVVTLPVATCSYLLKPVMAGGAFTTILLFTFSVMRYKSGKAGSSAAQVYTPEWLTVAC